MVKMPQAQRVKAAQRPQGGALTQWWDTIHAPPASASDLPTCLAASA